MWAEVLAASEDSRAVNDIRLARDRIDALETALADITNRFVVHQGVAGYNGNTLVGEIYEIARAALAPPVKEGK